MKDLIIIHRNMRLLDNAALFNGLQKQNYEVIFIFDEDYWRTSGALKDNYNLQWTVWMNLTHSYKSLNVILGCFAAIFQNFVIGAISLDIYSVSYKSFY